METNAQMQKGFWMLEGSAGLERSRMTNLADDEKFDPTTGYSFHPKVGYFVANNYALGVSGLFGNSWFRNKDYDQNLPNEFKKSNEFTYGGGLFLRKYMPINEDLSFFLLKLDRRFSGLNQELFTMSQREWSRVYLEEPYRHKRF